MSTLGHDIIEPIQPASFPATISVVLISHACLLHDLEDREIEPECCSGSKASPGEPVTMHV
jgi:hypothetical protein